jgi:hypothetical protein
MNKTITQQESALEYLMTALAIADTKEDFILAFWELWASSVTTTTREFQQIFANAPVNKWFITELEKEEKEFKILLALYPEIKGGEKDELYCKCINKLMSHFPMILLQNAKKRQEKPRTTKVKGVKIESSILNQN